MEERRGGMGTRGEEEEEEEEEGDDDDKDQEENVEKEGAQATRVCDGVVPVMTEEGWKYQEAP